MKKIKAVMGVFLSLLLCLSVSYADLTAEGQVTVCSCLFSDSSYCFNKSLSKASCKDERDNQKNAYCYDYSAPVIDPNTSHGVCSSYWVKQVCDAIVMKSCDKPLSDACKKQFDNCIKSTYPNCQCKRPQ